VADHELPAVGAAQSRNCQILMPYTHVIPTSGPKEAGIMAIYFAERSRGNSVRGQFSELRITDRDPLRYNRRGKHPDPLLQKQGSSPMQLNAR